MAEHTRTLQIVNELGLHARAASKLVRLAGEFDVELKIGRPDMMVDSKSIMGVLMLAAAQGSELRLVASGEDEGRCTEALDAISALVADRFGEER